MNRKGGRSGFFLLSPVFAYAVCDVKLPTTRHGEYITVSGGKSPDGRYLIATHGAGGIGLRQLASLAEGRCEGRAEENRTSRRDKIARYRG